MYVRVSQEGGDLWAPRLLLREAHRRIKESPGKYFENRVYGEKEGGGTQVLYLSAVDFNKLGLPKLSPDEHPSRWLRWQERVHEVASCCPSVCMA